MGLLIGLLGLGLAAIVVFFFKFSGDEEKRDKNIENAKDKRLAELDAEVLRKDGEMKKMMEERQKLEDEFFKTRDEMDIFKKENTEMGARLKQQDKLKDEVAELKNDIKQKDAMIHQEMVARQRLQGELSLKDMEREKAQAALEAAKVELKSKAEMYEGLKGQFEELECEIQRKGEENLRQGRPEKKGPAPVPQELPSAAGPGAKEDVKQEPQKQDAASGAGIAAQPASEKEKPDGPAPRPEPAHPPIEKNDSKPPSRQTDPNPKSPGPEEVPGFSGASGTKIMLGGGTTSDTDFLSSPVAPEHRADAKDPQEAPFKFTNINKPAPPQKEAPPDTAASS